MPPQSARRRTGGPMFERPATELLARLTRARPAVKLALLAVTAVAARRCTLTLTTIVAVAFAILVIFALLFKYTGGTMPQSFLPNKKDMSGAASATVSAALTAVPWWQSLIVISLLAELSKLLDPSLLAGIGAAGGSAYLVVKAQRR